MVMNAVVVVIRNLFCIWLSCFALASYANAQSGEGIFWDASNTVEVQVFEQDYGPAERNFGSCVVPAGYVCIGGGAWADYGSGQGALLTASYPDPTGHFASWWGGSKDQYFTDSHILHVYAIGLCLNGVSAGTLASYLTIVSNTSPSSESPNVEATLPLGYNLIGGGACVNYGSGQGNLLTASYPLNSQTWTVASKDLHWVDACTITAYAVGITTGAIPGFGTLSVSTISSSVQVANSVGTVSAYIPSGWVLACVGGHSTYNGNGRMLFNMSPVISVGDYVTVSSKDQIIADNGTTSYYATIIQNPL